MKKTEAEKTRRDEHMANALEYAETVVRDAQLRGVSGYDLFISFAAVVAARNPSLAGKLLLATSQAICAYPITKVIKPEPDEIELPRQADGSYGPPN